GEARRFHGGNVDLERRIVLSHDGPDAGDRRKFAVAEGRRVAVLIENRRGDVAEASPGSLKVAVEVQINGSRRPRQAVENRDAGERVECTARTSGGPASRALACAGRGIPDYLVGFAVDIIHSACCVAM